MTEDIAKPARRSARKRGGTSARAAAGRLAWARPMAALEGRSGTEFGRHIEEAARAVQRSGPMKVIVRKKPALVVLSPERYEELIEAKAQLDRLAESEGREVLESADEAFDSLLAQMQTQEHQSGMDAVFGASAEDLKAGFQPGLTETAD